MPKRTYANEADVVPLSEERQAKWIKDTLNNNVIKDGTVAGEVAEMQVLGMVLMPEDFPTVAYADIFTMDARCMKNIKQREPASWVNQPVPGMGQLKPEEFFATSHRGRGSIWFRASKYDPNKNSDLAKYTLKHSIDRGSVNDDTLWPQQTAGAINSCMDYNLGDCDGEGDNPPGSDFATACNTKTMVSGKTSDLSGYEGYRWTLINCVANPVVDPDNLGTTVTVTRKGGAVTSACSFFIVRLNNLKPRIVNQEIQFAAADPVNTSDSFDLSGDDGVTDFYAIVYQGNADNFQTGGVLDPSKGFSVVVKSYCGQLCQIPVQDAYLNIFQLGKMTTIAASMRITDMAAPLQIQGEMAVATTREPFTWMQYFQQSGGGTGGSVFTPVVNYRDSYLGPLRLGGYGYHLPFRSTQFELDECCQLDYQRTLIQDVWWDAEDDSGVNVFAARSTNSGNNNGLDGLGCDCWITLATHFNWETDNKWPQAATSPLSFTIWSACFEHLRTTPRAMSNRYHAGTLMRWLVNKGKIAKKYVGPFITAAGPLARRVAADFLGEEVTDKGVKLLKDAYGLGNEIAGRLVGGVN